MMKIDLIHRNPAQSAETYSKLEGTDQTPTRQPVDRVDPVQPSNKLQLLGDRREITIGVDTESETIITRVVDHRTNDIVYQVPQDRIVELAREVKRKNRLRLPEHGPSR